MFKGESGSKGIFRWVKEDEFSDEYVLSLLRPYVAEWFRRAFSSLTPPQRMAIPEIKAGKNVLISSPTGTGKTLAAFLALLDELYTLSERGKLEDGVYVVYVSPLRALNNDMKKNLLEPISGIVNIAKDMGIELSEIRVAVRTSDTTSTEKHKMLRKPPHILITTPESLAIALVAPKFREKLKSVRWVVIDEIHELASNKRGVHLSLSVERLEHLAGRPLKRIGLSATIAPLEDVALYLVGYDDEGRPKECSIVDARFVKPLELRVIVPADDLIYEPADKLNQAIYDALAQEVLKYRTTLVFTNTRSATERVVFKLRRVLKDNGIIDADEIEAHHSSLSRIIRLNVEDKLKKGSLRAVVCSTSLELGIDIGYIDAVVLLSSPKSVSRLLQRVGRSGHNVDRISKGILIVVDRDDLIECSVLAKAALDKKIDKIRIPRNNLDVLAQHIVGMAIESKWKIEDAYKLIKRSYNYRDLPFEDFMEILRYLSGAYSELKSMKVYGKIWLDEGEGMFGRRGGWKTRMIYMTNSGTIPDEAKIKVYSRNKFIGILEEAFVQILVPGDIFVLGGRTYEFLRSRGDVIHVRPVEGLRPTVPSWFSEMLPLAFDSALLVGEFRRKIAEKIKEKGIDEAIKWVRSEYGLDRRVAEMIVKYIWEQLVFTGGFIPSDRLVLIEVFDEDRFRNIIFHFLFGRRTNAALSRAYAYQLSKRYNINVKITVTDNGFMLTIPRGINVDVDWLINSVTSRNIRGILRKALVNTEYFARIFRHCAVRSFMILRRYMDTERSVNKLQLNAQNLLGILRDYENFPVIEETFREIMEIKMNIDGARDVLKKLEKGDIKWALIGPINVPSPFAHGIITHGYSDVVLMEDRKRLLKHLHEMVMERINRYVRQVTN